MKTGRIFHNSNNKNARVITFQPIADINLEARIVTQIWFLLRQAALGEGGKVDPSINAFALAIGEEIYICLPMSSNWIVYKLFPFVWMFAYVDVRSFPINNTQ